MSNVYLEYLEETLEGIDPKNINAIDPGFAILALVKEVQDAKKILKIIAEALILPEEEGG